MKQIYGYTGTHEKGEQYVRYVQVFENSDSVDIHVRNGQGAINVCSIPKGQLPTLLGALRMAAD